MRERTICDAAELCKTAYAKITRKGSGAQEEEGRHGIQSCRMLSVTLSDTETPTNGTIVQYLLEHYEDQPLVYLYNADMLLEDA